MSEPIYRGGQGRSAEEIDWLGRVAGWLFLVGVVATLAALVALLS